MEYLGYIFTAWMISFIILGILIGWILLDYRTLTSTLAKLEMRGIHRRSNEK